MGGTGPAAIRRGARRPCPLREEGGCARALDARRVPHGGGAAARDGPAPPRRGGPPRAGAVGDGEARAAARPRPGGSVCPRTAGVGATACAGAAARSAAGFGADRGAKRGAAGPARSESAGPRDEAVLLPSRGRRERTSGALPALRAPVRGFEARLGQMLRAEASLIRELPLRPAIH